MKKKSTPFLLLIPFIFIMAVLLAGLLNGIFQAMGYIPAYGLYDFTTEYFINALKGQELGQSIFISIYVALVSSVITIVLAVVMSFALVITKKDKGPLFAIIKIPMFVPWMVTAFIIVTLFSGSGFLARIFYNLGFEGVSQWFGNVLYSPGSMGIIIAFVWACTPFACFFIITVMSGISDTLGEAAQNLGANTFQLFRYIYLPLSLSSIKNVFLIVFLSCFGNYEIPMLLGMTKPRALPVAIYYEYNQYDLRNRPNAMALNTIMLFIALFLTVLLYSLFNGLRRKNEE